jgi:hypothetical protein
MIRVIREVLGVESTRKKVRIDANLLLSLLSESKNVLIDMRFKINYLPRESTISSILLP